MNTDLTKKIKELRRTKSGRIDLRSLNKNEKESYLESLYAILEYVDRSVADQYIFFKYDEESGEYWFYLERE